MALIREQFQELEGVIQSIYDLELKKKTDYVPKLFNVDSSKRASEKHFGTGSIGLMKKWAGTVNYDTVGKRWETEYRHVKYSNGLQVERELLDDEEFKEIKNRTRKLALSVYLTRQTHAASVFNNAFDTTIIGADGKPLCAKSTAGHPYSPENATDTQYNGSNLDLSPANLEKVHNIMIDYKDDRGNVLGVTPDTLVYGNYYRKKAIEILGTEKDVYTANNTMNIYGPGNEDNYKKLYCPWIIGKKWFLADSSMMELYMNWFNRRIPTIEMEDDFNTEVGSYKVVGRWSYGWDEWMHVFGNCLD